MIVKADNSPLPYDHDVAVIGGGPGGSAAAIALRRRGRSVVLLEPDPFPRFHIGESMLPMSNRVFRELGIYDAVVAAGFTPKFGATFIDAGAEYQTTYDFGELTDLCDDPTFQAPRAELDHLLLEQARAAGADVRAARATGLACDDAGASVTVQPRGDGAAQTLRVGAVVDASGRSGFVARRVGDVREQDTTLQKGAIYAHFRGVPRLEGRRAGDIRVVSVRSLGWLWFIPLPGGIESVGLVLDLSEFTALTGDTLQEKFERYVAAHVPAARGLLAAAEPVSEFRAESSFSYAARRYAAERWLLVGDAGSFLDPVFSSGVLLALLSAVDAAAAIDAGLRGTALETAPLARYGRTQRRRYRLLRRFIRGFYEQGMRDLFFAPRPTLGMMRCIATMLAGGWDPGFLDRRRIDAFYGLARLQRYLPLVPRLHQQPNPAPPCQPAPTS